MAHSLQKWTARILGALLVVGLGLVAGEMLQPTTAVATHNCPYAQCFTTNCDPEEPECTLYECRSTTNTWECNLSQDGDSCTTGECEDTHSCPPDCIVE